ncbi:MAG: hypothetical protein NT154_24430 [Verrucomicrobia bacterium]|nr:hypothetical protein [Verrucomicrobiota bacterium]
MVLSFIRDPLEAQDLIGNEQHLPLEELAREGQWIIEAKCALKHVVSLNLEMLRLATVLSNLSPVQLRERCHYDRTAGVVRIRCGSLLGVTRIPLFEELVANNPQVKLEGDHYLSCPAEWFLQLLTNFYGRAVTLD